MQYISGLIRQAVTEYNMIENGDKVAVGVSGGKDSITLLAGLYKLKQYAGIDFELCAIIMDTCVNGENTDYSVIEKFCAERDIPCYIKRTELWDIIFNVRKESNPCSLCARMRRGILHDMAKEYSCNKIALGHHFDDAIETFFMNLFEEGRIGCFSPKSYLSRKDLYLIRPLVYARESEVIAAVKRNNLPVVKSLCPVDKTTQREETKKWIATMCEKDPSFKKKIFGAMKRAHISEW